jgi:hypothetical protein
MKLVTIAKRQAAARKAAIEKINRKYNQMFQPVQNPLKPEEKKQQPIIINNPPLPRSFASNKPRPRSEPSLPTVSHEGLLFMEAVMNPFGAETRGPKTIGARVPDSDCGWTIPLVVTASGTFSGGTATSCVIQMNLPCLTADTPAGHAFYNGDVSDPTSSPTHKASLGTWNEESVMNAILNTGHAARIVASGIKVNAISSPDNTQGLLEAFHTDLRLAASTTTYNTYANVIDYPTEEPHTLVGGESGITVRGPFEQESWGAIPTYYYSASTSFGHLPCVRITSMSANTTVLVNLIFHVELRSSSQSIPFPITPSPVDLNYFLIKKSLSATELVVSGNSFKSVMKAIWKGIKKVAKVLPGNEILRGIISLF